MFRMIGYFFRLRNPFGLYRFPYNLYSWIVPLWTMTKDIYRWLFRGYPDCFVWSIDSSVSHFALPLVKRLKEINFGTPACFETNDDYLEVLDKIIYAFEAIQNDSPTEAWSRVKVNGGSNEEALAAMDIEQARIQEGCNLFGKYFQCLWW